MIFVVRFLVIFSMMLSFWFVGCGEHNTIERALDTVFVMGSKPKEEFKVELNEEDEREETVKAQLASLNDPNVNLEKDPKSFSKALSYMAKIISRSSLVHPEKRSKCQCKYAYSTFKQAVENYGKWLVELKKQNVESLIKGELQKYKQVHTEFSQGVKTLEYISKDLNSTQIAEIDKEVSEIEEIQKIAKKYFDELGSSKTSSKEENSKDKSLPNPSQGNDRKSDR